MTAPDGLTTPAARSWARLGVAMAAMVLLPASVTGTNLAFPDIEADFGSSRAVLSWILSGYSIATAAFTLLGGRLADRIGARRMFRVGVSVFVVGAGASSIAPSVALLIAGRVLQGVGAALFLPSSLAMVLPDFERVRHPFVIGLWAAAIPVGSSASPTATSLVLAAGSWRWVFAIQFLAGLAVLAGAVAVGGRNQAGDRTHRPDYLGVPVGTVVMALVALGIVQGPRWGWGSPGIVGSFVGAAVLLPLFIARTRAHPAPLVDLSLFSIPTFRFANLVSVGVSLVGSSVWLLWPIHLTSVWGYSELEVGLAITPTPLLAGAASIVSGRWAGEVGYRGMLVVGTAAMSLANLWFLLFYGAEPAYLTRMLPGLVLYGVAMGFCFAPLNAAALADVPTSAYGQANAAFNTGRSLSGAVGIAALIAILGDASGVDALGEFDAAFGFLTALSVASLVGVLILWPRRLPTTT